MENRFISHYKLQIFLILAMVVWGLSWTNAKILGDYTSPQISMVWRFILAILLFIPVMHWTDHSFKFPRGGIKYVLAYGFFMTIYNYFYFRGTQVGLAGAGGVLVTTLNPIITTFFTVIILKDTLKSKDMVGSIFGFLGGIFIIKIWMVNYSDLVQNGNIHFLLAAISWAFVTLITSTAKEKIHYIPYSFWSIVLAGIFSAILSIGEPIFTVFNYGWNFWLNLFLLSGGAMVFGTTIYFLAAIRLGSRRASAYIFTVPVTAMGFSVIILGEQLDWSTTLGSILAVSGVYLINKS